MLHYLTPEEEISIKRNIPWEMVDVYIRETVRLANLVEGIATVQSCQGHVSLIKGTNGGFHLRAAHIAFKATKKRMEEFLFILIPREGIWDASIRYWSDGAFWICVETDPAERWRLDSLFRKLVENEEGGSE